MNMYGKILHSSSLLSRLHSPLRISPISARNVGAYQGHGKTTLEFMNKDKNGNEFHTIKAYSVGGFRLANGTFVIGPMILHGKTVLGWNIKDDKAINEDSLEFFRHMDPPLDLLILGLADDKSLKSFNKDLIIKFRKLNLPLEILPSTRACQMYNFVAGLRNVAGAFLPPRRFKITTDDYLDNIRKLNMQQGPEMNDGDEGLIVRQAKDMKIKDA